MLKNQGKAFLWAGIFLIAAAPFTLLFSFQSFYALFFSTFGNAAGYEAVTGHLFSASIVMVMIVIGIILVSRSRHTG